MSATIAAAQAARLVATFEAMINARPPSQIAPMVALLAARLLARVEILVEVKPDALAALDGSPDLFLAMVGRAGFSAYEIAKFYQPADGMWPCHAFPQRLRRGDFAMADLVFRRAPPGSKPEARCSAGDRDPGRSSGG